MAIVYGSAKVSVRETVNGVKSKVSREVKLPKEANTIDDVLELCDGKLTSARGEKPGLIDAALSGINAFLRRKETEQIKQLLGGKDSAVNQLASEILNTPGMTEEKARKFATMIVEESWTEEQEKARQSLTIVPVTGDEDESEETE